VRAAIHESLENLLLFPQIGRPQTAKGVRRAGSGRRNSAGRLQPG